MGRADIIKGVLRLMERKLRCMSGAEVLLQLLTIDPRCRIECRNALRLSEFFVSQS